MTIRNTMIPIAAAVLLSAGFPTGVGAADGTSPNASSAATSAQVKTEVTEAIAAIKSYSAEQRDEALQKGRKAMQDLDRAIDRREAQLRNDWSELSAAGHEKAQAALADLKEKRNALGEWYGGLSHSTSGAWDEVKTGFSNALADLQQSWERAGSEFKTEQ